MVLNKNYIYILLDFGLSIKNQQQLPVVSSKALEMPSKIGKLKISEKIKEISLITA